jgi:hypothetical protein
MSDSKNSSERGNRPSNLKEHAGILGVGLLGNQLIVWAFDYGLYPFVMWQLGLVWGCVVMTASSAAVCYFSFIFYDWTKKDWLGIEAIKEFKEGLNMGKIAQRVSAILNKSELLAFFVLSLKFDPFITVLYLRKGSYQFNGLTKRDWTIFWSSVVISNIYWSFVAFTGVTIFVWAIDKF